MLLSRKIDHPEKRYADAVQDAMTRGVDPTKDPKVQQLADTITQLQKQPNQSGPDIQHLYAAAVQDAIGRGIDPRQDAKVQQIADMITQIQKQGNTETSTAEDQRYEKIVATPKNQRNPSDESWRLAYEKRKTPGPALTTAATENRLNQTEQFQQQEKGREHLTKAENDYQDAAAKADLIRDAIRQAQAGNKMAGAYQGMLATLGLTTMEGVKRVNAVELGIPTSAGSVWDRVQNKIGQWTAGQPMDASLQRDLSSLADTLQQSAYKKYKANHGSITKRYQLNDEQPLPGPVSGASPQGGGAGKALSMAAIQQAAKDHGVSVEEAKRQAQAAGYAIQ